MTLKILESFNFTKFFPSALGMCFSLALIINYYICIDDVLNEIKSDKFLEIRSNQKIKLLIKGSDHYFISVNANYEYYNRDSDLVEIDNESFFGENSVYSAVAGKSMFGKTIFFIKNGRYVENYYFKQRNLIFGIWILLLMTIYTIWIGFKV